MSTAFICDRCHKVEKDGQPAVHVNVSAEEPNNNFWQRHAKVHLECCHSCANAVRDLLRPLPEAQR